MILQLIQSSLQLKQLLQRIARLAGVPVECWCAALWLSQSTYPRNYSILLPVSASSRSHIAFVVSWSVVHVLSQGSLLSEYRVLLLHFCLPITINRKTALLLFVVRFPHASFSAVVCLCDSHVYFCACMCIAVYEFPLKNARRNRSFRVH